VQPLRDSRVALLAQREELLEHDLRGHADEFDELRIGLLVRVILLGSPEAREISVKSRTISPTSPLSASRSEIWPVPSPYRNPVHHNASALARPLSGCSSSGSKGWNSMPCSPKDAAVAANTRSIMAADSSDSEAPSGSISLTQSCIRYGAMEQSAPHNDPCASAASARLPAAASTSSKSLNRMSIISPGMIAR
jgi:hypothetical protein